MKKIILIFSLLLFTAVTFAQTNAELAIAKNRKIDKCISGDCENGTGVSEISNINFRDYFRLDDEKPINVNAETYLRDCIKSEGQWKNGKLFNGEGYLLDAVIKDKTIKYLIYYGEVKDGQRFGKGIFIDENNNKIEGTLDANNQYIFKSKLYYIDYSYIGGKKKETDYSYVGGEMNDKFEGQGLLIFNNKYKEKDEGNHVILGDYYSGKQYEGIFEKGMLVKGTILYDDKSKEECDKIDFGYIKIKRWDKKGELVFEGIRPVKDYKRIKERPTFYTCQGDCNNGFGKKTDPNGNTYEGTWKNNVYDGKGKLQYPNINNYYDGEWKNGLPDGLGYWQGRDKDEKHLYKASSYSGGWLQGKKNGHGKYFNGLISMGYVSDQQKVECEFTNDIMANQGITTIMFSYHSEDYKLMKTVGRIANWHLENGKIFATIIQNKFKENANDQLNGEFYKYEGEIDNIYDLNRIGIGTTYKTMNDTHPVTELYISDDNHNAIDAEEEFQLGREAKQKYRDSLCDKCLGQGFIYQMQTVGGGTYTTGGETVNSQHATTSGIIEKSDGSKYIETTTTSSTYKNPTYTHTGGSYEKQVKVTCPVCNGTGKKK